MQRLTHLPQLPQMRRLWNLGNTPEITLDYGGVTTKHTRSQKRIHLPELQQMLELWNEPAARS